MANNIENRVKALVIADTDYKEYDKLFTLFTKELGKIRAYAFGIRREHSKKIGLLRLFSFLDIELRGESDKYSINDVNVIESFDALSSDYEKMCYASYFVEIVDYMSFENIESTDILNLLYFTFKALVDDKIEVKLIKSVFELKMLKYQGEYIESDMIDTNNETLKYTWDYVINAKTSKLYNFKLEENVFNQFKLMVDKEFKSKVNKKFKSLDKLVV